MTKNEQIRKLFDENYEKLLSADVTTPVTKNGICYDGIVDEAIFDKCKYKIVFLLKETNGNRTIKNSDGTEKVGLPEELNDWNYRDWLEKQQAYGLESPDTDNSNSFYGSTFNKLCMWIDILHDVLNSMDIHYNSYYIKRYNTTNFRELLKSTAIINLKKTWGKEKTEWKDLYSYLHQQNNNVPIDVIKKEMDIINPDIVICGGDQVFDFAQEIFNEEILRLELSNGESFRYFKRNETIFLDFYHPACKGAIEKYYNYAKIRFETVKYLI